MHQHENQPQAALETTPAHQQVAAQPRGARRHEGSAIQQGWVLGAAVLLAAIGYSAGPALQDGSGGLDGSDYITSVIPVASGGVSSDSNNTMIAVTGNDVTGQSVLYLIDTVNRHIAVYQANGGSSGTQGIKLVGARRIDLDLQLNGFNDETETGGRSLSYEDLLDQFRSKGLLPEEND